MNGTVCYFKIIRLSNKQLSVLTFQCRFYFFIYIFILICVCEDVFALLYVILIFLLSNKIRPNEQCIVSNQNKRLKRELIFFIYQNIY